MSLPIPPRPVKIVYPTGAVAGNTYGSLYVDIPRTASHQRDRSDARVFTRSIWGPDADVLGYVPGHVYGTSKRFRRYPVVIVGDANRAAERAADLPWH